MSLADKEGRKMNEETKRTERPWTPGPWAKDYGLTVGHIKSTAQIDKSQTVARYDILPGLLMPEAEQQANAHLIAAAPTQHEALDNAPRRQDFDTVEEFLEAHEHWFTGQRQEAISLALGGNNG